MVKIKLLNTIDPELRAIGLKPGDTVFASPDPASICGGMHFTVSRYGRSYNCSIWPIDYEIVEPFYPKNKSRKSAGKKV